MFAKKYRLVPTSEEQASIAVDTGEDAVPEDAAEIVQTNEDDFAKDPFRPFNDLPPERNDILTLRAIIVGILCGTLVNTSNIYLGLKSGWTASANIFASILGFTVLKYCSTHFRNIPLLGRDFGPRENNIVQTTATAAGGMSNVFVSAFPAMYQLGLLDTPQRDFWRISILTALGGYFGFFFATPLRKFFICWVGKELGLIFPSSSATAISIRGMHMAAEGSSSARNKTKALGLAFGFAAILRVLSQYFMGLLWDWHIFTWLFSTGLFRGIDVYLESWGWFIEWSPAFIGTGMLVGLNVSISYLAGSILAWGIIGPLLVANGKAFGSPILDDGPWSGLTSYTSLSSEYTTLEHPSPRYWLLWPGVSCMIAVSLTDLLCQWRIFWFSGKALFKALSDAYNIVRNPARWRDNSRPVGKLKRKQSDVEDSASDDEMVQLWMWLPGLIVVLILTCIVMGSYFEMPVKETLLALFLAFFFSFLAIQATGATDITPLTAASKASQIILGAVTKSEHWTLERSQRMNLLGGAFASVGANQAVDLVGDFRVGYLLRTSPKLQWLAQGIGTLVAVFLAPGVYVLFSNAYPCIHDVNTENCPFHVPSVGAWRAVAVAVTEPNFTIPSSSKYFSIGFAIIGVVMVLIRRFLLVGNREWIRNYYPNMMVLSLAFIIDTTVVGTAMVIGAIIATLWASRSSRSFDDYGYGVAAGFMAGEGIGGVINAIIQMLGFSGDVYGTGLLCPASKC
ncbi:MAG: hypothetical protein M1820_010644 [Bogoriella megaspora]|nr:MAG: hypothetical protein M1820_010644 [Bogoriella megaspora]